MTALTRQHRETLLRTADYIALLPVPGCRELSGTLECLARTADINPVDLLAAADYADGVRARLLAETSADRWIDEVRAMTGSLDMVVSLMSERAAQASAVADAAAALRTAATARVPA